MSPQIENDRFCCIRLQLSELPSSTLSIIGVYLPCIDQGLDVFAECLSVLESLVCDSKRLGPVIVAGDFNAHLGTLGGPRGLGSPNQQGFLVKELIDRTYLHVFVPFRLLLWSKSHLLEFKS